jgi:hypothetical protein
MSAELIAGLSLVLFLTAVFLLGLCAAASLGDQMGAEARRQLEDREVQDLDAAWDLPTFDPRMQR